MFTVLVSLLLSLIRGKDFHVAFNYISDLCSTVTPKVHIIALTAEVFRTVTGKLCLENPIVIGLTPNRENKYSIKPQPKIEVFCELCAENLHHMCTNFPKTSLSAPLLNVSQYINT